MYSYQVLKVFTHPKTGGYMAIGNTFDDDGALGQKLCRDGYAKDVTTIAATIDERVTDLETKVDALESEQYSASASVSSSASSSVSSSSSSSASASASAS